MKKTATLGHYFKGIKSVKNSLVTKLDPKDYKKVTKMMDETGKKELSPKELSDFLQKNATVPQALTALDKDLSSLTNSELNELAKRQQAALQKQMRSKVNIAKMAQRKTEFLDERKRG